MIVIKCPNGTGSSLERVGFVKKQCFLINGVPKWGEVDLSECETKVRFDDFSC